MLNPIFCTPYQYQKTNNKTQGSVISFSANSSNRVIDSIIKKIDEAQNIVIIPHMDPDGDANVSSSGLYDLIEKRTEQQGLPKKNVDVISWEKIDKGYEKLFGKGNIQIISGKDMQPYRDGEKKYDLAIAVDCSQAFKLKKPVRKNIFNKATTKIKIDHHHEATKKDAYGDINYVDDKAVAASQLILRLANRMGIPVDKKMAQKVFYGMYEDSAGFEFTGHGKDTNAFNKELDSLEQVPGFNKNEFIATIKKQKNALLNTPGLRDYETKVLDTKGYKENGQVVFITEKEEFLADADKITQKDPQGRKEIVCRLLSKKLMGADDDVKIGILLKPKNNGTVDHVNVSIRGKDGFPVNLVSNVFGGGGHSGAAGFSVQGTANPQEAMNQIMTAIKEQNILKN